MAKIEKRRKLTPRCIFINNYNTARANFQLVAVVMSVMGVGPPCGPLLRILFPSFFFSPHLTVKFEIKFSCVLHGHFFVRNNTACVYEETKNQKMSDPLEFVERSGVTCGITPTTHFRSILRNFLSFISEIHLPLD